MHLRTVNNRFLREAEATRPERSARRASSSDVEINQSYYTDQRASRYDRRYSTSLVPARRPSHFLAALASSVRATPASEVNASLRAEFDRKYRQLRTISAQGTYGWRQEIQTTVGWSKKAFIDGLSEASAIPPQLDHYINASANVHTKDNRFGGLYSFNYDVLRTFMQQRASPASTTPSAAVSRMRIPGLQLPAGQLHDRRRPTTGSSCRSRWRASATSLHSTAR